MADAEVRVIAHAVGFEDVAARARRAEEQLRSMGAAARTATASVNTSGVTQQIERDMARAVSGMRIGHVLGEEIRKGISTTLGNQGYWSRAFSGIGNRLRTAGRELGTTIAAGIAAGVGTIRGVEGHGGGRGGGRGGNRHGASHFDLHGGVIVGGATLWGFESIGEAAGKREQARLNLADTGLVSPQQAKTLEGLARSWRKKYGNISTTEGLDFLKDATQILGGADHLFGDHGKSSELTADAVKGFDRIGKLMSYMKTRHGAEKTANVAEEFSNAIRSAEVFGRGNKVEEIADWTARLTQISLATGVSPTDFLSAQRTAGASFFTLNDDALGIFAAYVQENKQRAGVQLMTGFMHMVGGNNQRGRGNQALQKLGLLPNDPKHVKKLARQGKVKLDSKGNIAIVNDMSLVKDYQKLAQNPYAWMAEDLYPSIREKIKHDKGYDIGDIGTPVSERGKEAMVDIMQQIGGVFSQRNEATQAVEAIVQYNMLKRRADNIRKANPDYEKRRASYYGQLEILGAQWEDMKVSLGESVLPNIISVVEMMRGALGKVQSFAESHSTLAKWGMGGIGGALLLNGAISGAMLFGRFLGIGRMFRFIEGAALIGTGIIAGILKAAGSLLGFNTNFGTIMAKGSISGLAKKLGFASRFMRLLIPILGALSRFALVATLLDQAIGRENLKDIGKALWGDISRADDRKDRWKKLDDRFRNWIDEKVGKDNPVWSAIKNRVYGPDKLPPAISATQRMEWLNRYKWMHRYRNDPNDIPLPVRRPFQDPSFMGLGDHMPSLGRRRIRNDLRQGRREAASGPVPVVITNDKKANRPNVINTTVNVNVQSNASPQAIGGAVGSAVASQVQGALSDQHH